MSEGTNALIRLGATLVTKPEDILIEMGVYVPRKKKKGKRIEAEMTPDEQKIYDRLSHVPVFIDDLIPQDSGDIQGTFSLLLSMEQRGLIRQAMQGYYVRG
jgi:DNA processing protein